MSRSVYDNATGRLAIVKALMVNCTCSQLWLRQTKLSGKPLTITCRVRSWYRNQMGVVVKRPQNPLERVPDAHDTYTMPAGSDFWPISARHHALPLGTCWASKHVVGRA
jgi:hypothetical protein